MPQEMFKQEQTNLKYNQKNLSQEKKTIQGSINKTKTTKVIPINRVVHGSGGSGLTIIRQPPDHDHIQVENCKNRFRLNPLTKSSITG